METAEEQYFRLQRAYWLQVAESEGFDLEHVVVPPSMIGRINGLIAYDCERYFNHYPHRVLVKNYANVGLHRYNMLKGTKFHLGSLKKFNMLQNFVSSYYMTLLADDLRTCPSGKDFQVRVDERTYGSLDLTVSVARPKDELVTTKMPFIPHFHGGASAAAGIFKGDLPDWPSDDDLKDQNRFYLVKEADMQFNNWILMYLELVICAADRSINSYSRLSGLNIVEVVIETTDVLQPKKRLKAKCAIVYISFKGISELHAPQQVFPSGVNLKRQAIVRRVMDDTGYLTLVGKLCGGEKKE